MLEDISHLFPALNTDTTYRVAYRGKFLAGHSSTTIASHLKQELGMSEPQIQAFLSKKRFIICKNLPRKKAAKLRAKLREAGLDVVANSARKLSGDSERVAQRASPAPAPATAPAPAATIPVAANKDHSRWIVLGVGVLFTLGVLWLFFSI